MDEKRAVWGVYWVVFYLDAASSMMNTKWWNEKDWVRLLLEKFLYKGLWYRSQSAVLSFPIRYRAHLDTSILRWRTTSHKGYKRNDIEICLIIQEEPQSQNNKKLYIFIHIDLMFMAFLMCTNEIFQTVKYIILIYLLQFASYSRNYSNR